jgi:hypothetical protein
MVLAQDPENKMAGYPHEKTEQECSNPDECYGFPIEVVFFTFVIHIVFEVYQILCLTDTGVSWLLSSGHSMVGFWKLLASTGLKTFF